MKTNICKVLFIFIIVIYFLPEQLKAQSNFKEGFIITNQNDTITGLIDSRGEWRNMKVCHFKKSAESEVQTYSPGTIQGYRFTDGKYYVTKHIETKTFSSTVFVEFLLEGIRNLYFYANSKYRAYFVESREGKLLEIRDMVARKKDGETIYVKSKKYKGYLNYVFENFPEIQNDIKNMDLTHKQLIRVAKKYHDYVCKDGQCIIYEKKLPVLKVRILPFVGYSSNSYNITGQLAGRYAFITLLNFDKYGSANIGADFNFIVPRFNETISLIAGIQFSKEKFSGSTSRKDKYYVYNNNTDSENLKVMLDGGIQYTYPKGDFRPFVSLGMCYENVFKEDTKWKQELINNNGEKMLNNESLNFILNSPKLGYIFKLGGYFNIGKQESFFRLSYSSCESADNMPLPRTKETYEESKALQFAVGVVF